ncbi:hypothetical protein CHLRE_10g444183v5 [Chlamydomonas reinhardtii]|uniref:Uncharacterized protein n=1 Tax=Chlamydomonas reinhardtii TaxID=3055 RepID=A0A2K3DAP9_CHLRE|nr:uncharacterized protein CHLRE_10g444183v5 [Chlamydomonas reinhardtii]PNW77608.1 hypothetical protein CHLRE_10g444183v5 [Chlamydomonas reinhardtii]
MNMCSLWSDLSVDFLSFGSMLLILGQLTFLVLATTINYVGLRTGAAIKSAMQLTRKSATTALQAKRHGSWPKLLVLGRTGAKANAGGGGGDAVGCRCGWPATAHRVRRATGHYRRPGSQQDAASGAFITASTAAAVTNACGASGCFGSGGGRGLLGLMIAKGSSGGGNADMAEAVAWQAAAGNS